jgi:hypothetical protein
MVRRYVPGTKLAGSALEGKFATIIVAVAVGAVSVAAPNVTLGLNPKLVPETVRVLRL